MSRWWFWTQYKCRECGAKWDEFDPRGGNYDSGFSGPVPVQDGICEECSEREAA